MKKIILNSIKSFGLFFIFFLLLITPGVAHAKENIKCDPTQCTGMEQGDICTAGNCTIEYLGFDDFGNRKVIVKQVDLGFDDRYINSPFLTDYLAAMYRYAVIVTTILATIVIIFAGVLWITSAGNSEQIGRAKKMIGRAITGLVIAVGSYTILWTINPQLVEFGSLKILRVKDISVDEALGLEINENWDIPTPSGNISDTTYDELFKNYASCTNMDWRILKGVAYKESSFRANLVNKYGFIGLFQTKTSYCNSLLKKRGWTDMCSDLYNPSNNTAVGMAAMELALRLVEKSCPNAILQDKLALLYLAHNTGPGALKGIMEKGGCSKPTLEPLFLDYWTKKGNPTWGPKRFNYAYSVADVITGLGLTSVTGSKEGVCPR